MTLPIVIPILAVLGLIVIPAVKIVYQYQRGVVFRFGKLKSIRQPGLNLILPWIDRMVKVDLRTRTVILTPQEVITRDNVTVHVDAVVYFNIIDPERAVIQVEDFALATEQLALTTLRSVLGRSDLDELLAHRDRINERLRDIIDEHTEQPWGVMVTLVEVRDVLLPENMQRVMARQAEAEREKRAKIIHAEGELDAAEKLVQAGAKIASEPVSLQLRYLQTLVEMAGERTSTIIPIPLDVMSALTRLVKD
ncbi:MAG: slipin family protein [Chloroflexi bacterium]|nr:slipin family protein [Chloroflexota bacterium]MBU1751518.1 slipin family protein [Chloroflexota bacterium]